MQRMIHFYLQSLVLLVLLMVTSECSGISTVIASQREDITLPCLNDNGVDPEECHRVRWIKRGREIKIILARPKTPTILDAERVKWLPGGNGLYLTKLQKSDEALYSCEIWKDWDCIYVGNISLIVKECKVIKLARAVRDTPVTLNCPVNVTSAQQRPTDTTWVKLTGGNPVPINSGRVQINGTSLAIQSVNDANIGWYRCTYTLGQTQRCFDFNLQVQGPSDLVLKTRKQGSSAAFIAVVASVILAIASLAALTGWLIYRRRYSQRIAQQAHRCPAGSFTGSTHFYEDVNSMASDDPAFQQDDTVYNVIQEESLCT